MNFFELFFILLTHFSTKTPTPTAVPTTRRRRLLLTELMLLEGGATIAADSSSLSDAAVHAQWKERTLSAANQLGKSFLCSSFLIILVI